MSDQLQLRLALRSERTARSDAETGLGRRRRPGGGHRDLTPDLVARRGGDEFAGLLDGSPTPEPVEMLDVGLRTPPGTRRSRRTG